MNITDTLVNRLKELRDTQAQLELNLEPLNSVKEEIVLIERMMGLADGDNTQSVRDDLYKALQGLIN